MNPETPEGDLADQLTEVTPPEEDELGEAPLEADALDAADQRRIVSIDEEDEV